MWLLDTHTLKLHYFDSPEAVEEGYMILSHVWDDSEESETSFQDIQRIHEQCTESGEDPHDLVNTKIRKCCELGERHGYKWAWIDTCCIDKTSSAELMEAINGMYRFYALSSVCYVYLADTRSEHPNSLRYSLYHPVCLESEPLIKTTWQSRGWTLQELLAPRVVHFLSREWKLLGTRNDLADALELGWGIPASVLRHEQSPLEFSVARRMSWAAGRETTRLEDEAYSLLGLFGINMPTLYGEGRKAFQRLQEEILKQTGDTTLFAWGVSAPLEDLREHPPDDARTGLFATAPSDFESARDIQTIPKLKRKTTEFRTTPHGSILARIPVVHIDGQAFGDLAWSQGSARLWLVLMKRNPTASYLPIPVYDVGVHNASVTPGALPVRMVKLHAVQDDASVMHASYRPSLRTILLLTHRPPEESREPIYLPLNHGYPSTIRFPEGLMRKLLRRRTVSEVSAANAQLPWSGDPPLMIAFRDERLSDTVYAMIQFGLCSSYTTNGEESGSLWATFLGSSSRWECIDWSHQCPSDHVLNWPGLRKRFVLQFYAHDDRMGDRIAKWLFDMEFNLSVTTGVLILTHARLELRPLYQDLGFRDIKEEGEEIQLSQNLADEATHD